MNETKIKTVSEERDEAIWLMNKTSLELNRTKAQLAATEKASEERLHRLMDEQRISSNLSDQLSATEEALQQVQRESAELRTERDNATEEVELCRADAAMLVSKLEEFKAAKKVADAAVELKYGEFDGGLDMHRQRSYAVSDAVDEYRALTLAEPSDVDEKEDGLGFFPGFPPGFDVKRAEKGLAQEGGSREAAHGEAETGQDSILGRRR